MVWIRSSTTRAIDIRADVDRVRALLADVVGTGHLMPGVAVLEPAGENTYHYVLEPFSNGAVTLVPDYRTRFDTSDPARLRWAPDGEHNFMSEGGFRTHAGAAPGETTLEIETSFRASVDVAPVVLPLIEPFAQRSNEDVTESFLRAIKTAAEESVGGPTDE
ncbi:MAG TPA: SRPBCC family protein [Pseudonocardiaceae bacterium]